MNLKEFLAMDAAVEDDSLFSRLGKAAKGAISGAKAGWNGTQKNQSLEQHDKRFHPQGYEKGDTCKFREKLGEESSPDDLSSGEKKDNQVTKKGRKGLTYTAKKCDSLGEFDDLMRGAFMRYGDDEFWMEDVSEDEPFFKKMEELNPEYMDAWKDYQAKRNGAKSKWSRNTPAKKYIDSVNRADKNPPSVSAENPTKAEELDVQKMKADPNYKNAKKLMSEFEYDAEPGVGDITDDEDIKLWVDGHAKYYGISTESQKQQLCKYLTSLYKNDKLDPTATKEIHQNRKGVLDIINSNPSGSASSSTPAQKYMKSINSTIPETKFSGMDRKGLANFASEWWNRANVRGKFGDEFIPNVESRPDHIQGFMNNNGIQQPSNLQNGGKIVAILGQCKHKSNAKGFVEELDQNIESDDGFYFTPIRLKDEYGEKKWVGIVANPRKK